MDKEEKLSAGDKLLSAASELFAAAGIRATGIDVLIEKADVAKNSLYNNFTDKDGLIVHYLKEQERKFILGLTAATKKKSNDSSCVERLTSWIKAIEKELLAGIGDYLYAHVNALAEFPNPDHVVHKEVLAFRQRLFEWIRRLFKSDDIPDLDKVIMHLLFIIDGICIGHRYGSSFENINQIAEIVLTS